MWRILVLTTRPVGLVSSLLVVFRSSTPNRRIYAENITERMCQRPASLRHVGTEALTGCVILLGYKL